MEPSTFDGLSWCFENGVGLGAERDYVRLRAGSKRGSRKQLVDLREATYRAYQRCCQPSSPSDGENECPRADRFASEAGCKTDSRRKRRSRDGGQALVRSASGGHHGATEVTRGIRRRMSVPVRSQRNPMGSSDKERWRSRSFRREGISTPEPSISSLGRDSVEGTDISRSLNLEDFVGDEDTQTLTDEADTLGTEERFSVQDMAGEVDVVEEMTDEPDALGTEENIYVRDLAGEVDVPEKMTDEPDALGTEEKIKVQGMTDEVDVQEDMADEPDTLGIEEKIYVQDIASEVDVQEEATDEPDTLGIEYKIYVQDMAGEVDVPEEMADEPDTRGIEYKIDVQDKAGEVDVPEEMADEPDTRGIEYKIDVQDMAGEVDVPEEMADEPDTRGIEYKLDVQDMAGEVDVPEEMADEPDTRGIEYKLDVQDMAGEVDVPEEMADEPDAHQEVIEKQNASADVAYAEDAPQGKADDVADQADGVHEEEVQSNEGGLDFSALLEPVEVMDAVGSDDDEAADKVTEDAVETVTPIRQPAFGRIGRGVRRLVYLALGGAPVVLWSSGVGRSSSAKSLDVWTQKTVAMTRMLHAAIGRGDDAAIDTWSQKAVARARLLYAVVGTGCDAAQGAPVVEPTSSSSSLSSSWSSSSSLSSSDAGRLSGDVALGLGPDARVTASLAPPTIVVVAEDGGDNKVAIPGELESGEAGKPGTLRRDVDRSANVAADVDAQHLSSCSVLDRLMGKRSLCVVDFPKNDSRDYSLGSTGIDTKRAKKARVHDTQGSEAAAVTGFDGLMCKDTREYHGVLQVPGDVDGSSETRPDGDPYSAEGVNGGVPGADAFLHGFRPTRSGPEEVNVVSDADRPTDTNFSGMSVLGDEIQAADGVHLFEPWFNFPDGEMRTVRFIRRWNAIRKGRTSESHCTSETLMLGPMKGRKDVMVFQEPGQFGKIVWASMRNPVTRAKKAAASWIRSAAASVAGVGRGSESSPPVGCSGVHLSRVDGNLALVIDDGAATKAAPSGADRVVVIDDVGSSSPEEDSVLQGERGVYVAMMAPRGHVCVLSDSGWIYWMSKGVNKWRMSRAHGV